MGFSGFEIAFMDGTRYLALLRSGIREIVTLKPRDPVFLTAKNKLNFHPRQRRKRPEI